MRDLENLNVQDFYESATARDIAMYGPVPGKKKNFHNRSVPPIEIIDKRTFRTAKQRAKYHSIN